ncbi:zinc-finger-containing protein [Sphingobium sp. HDIP04]|uniref:zinc-finger-containing protein n=1 Tax=Sphingobium sp. HDIP04 TaxID=428994 RepID=UPI00038790DC|nr:zinc-finger-containing protein [Sphingobium sp. HDIP04]EQA97116.1 hypothetical protein L286_23255 [Sphingobium sp. HDIP04]
MIVDPNDFTPEALAKVAPTCADCDSAERVTMARGPEIYPHRPDLADKLFWRCGCGAYCGVHAGTLKSLGRPAGKATRDARQAAHAAFDPLWERKMRRDGVSKQRARGAGYKWLASQIGIAPKDCHIGDMDRATALKVVEVCQNIGRKSA